MRLRWSSYVAPKSPKGGLKNAKRPIFMKNALRLKEVCYKVSLCEIYRRQSCKAGGARTALVAIPVANFASPANFWAEPSPTWNLGCMANLSVPWRTSFVWRAIVAHRWPILRIFGLHNTLPNSLSFPLSFPPLFLPICPLPSTSVSAPYKYRSLTSM